MIPLNDIEKAYDSYSRDIFVFIMKYTGNTETAEDILHDVFISLIEHSWKPGTEGEKIKSLLYRMARNRCIDHSRKISRRNTYACEPEKLDIIIRNNKNDEDDSRIGEILDEITDSMSEPEKSILILKKNGMTYSEISSVIGTSERTIKRKMKNIINMLRENFKNRGFNV